MRTFYPRKARIIQASAPHPEGTQYKVSIGDEDWGNGTFQSVIKVQMMYDGKVAGRMSPSYPVGTDDYERVSAAIFELESGHENTHMVPTMLTKDGLLASFNEIITLAAPNHFLSYQMAAVFDFMFFHFADDVKIFRDYHPKEADELIDELIAILEKLDTDDEDFPGKATCFLESIRELNENHDAL